MELFKVTLSYQTPSMGTRAQAVTYAAVFGNFGTMMVSQAAKVAIDGIIGVGADLTEWQVVVESVKQIGTVHVDLPKEEEKLT
jgi:hypothetical protein